MLRRDGNIIGNPLPTNTSSATGVFRISASQQKNILTKFPEHIELPEKPLFVTCLRGRTPAFPKTNFSTPSPTGRTPSSALQTGQILIRIASPKDWKARSSSATSSNVVLEEESEYAGKATITGYSVEITASNYGTDADGVGGDWTAELSYQFFENGVVTNATRSAFGTIFLPIEDNVDCSFHSSLTNNSNTRYAPSFGTPFEDEDNVFNIILNDVTAGPVNRTGNTGLRGMPKDAYYSIRVFTENAKGASVSATESNQIDCTYDFFTTQRYILFRDYGSAFGGYPYPVRPPGSYYLDFMLLGGGASGGSVRGYGASGGGGAGSMVIGYGYRLKKNEKTYNITIGTGGTNGNGSNSSAFGCIAFGGGVGASAGRFQSAGGTNYLGVSAAQSGGCGGGAVGGFGSSAGLVSVTAFGLTGAMDGKTSGPSYSIPSTEFDTGLLNVYESIGGGVQVSADSTLRSFYSEQIINNVQSANTNPAGHGGGGCGNVSGIHSNTNQYGTGGPGKYIRWATPGICSLIPQVGRIPFAINYQYSTIGSSPEINQQSGSNPYPSNKGFFGGGGSAYNNSFYNSQVGGGGLGRFENQTFQSTIDSFTYSATGVNGLGAGGGGVRSNNNDPNSFYPAADGGDGICIIRMARSAHDPTQWSDTFYDYYAMSATGSFQTTAIGAYIYFIFDGDGTFGPKGRAGITGDGN